MYKTLLVLSLALVGCYALTDEEIALFFNDGCGGGSVSMERSGDEIIFTTNGVPDHKWQLCNPDAVLPQEETVAFPNEPTFAEVPYCLSGGPIGWAINGVAIYNPFALGEINAVDGTTQEIFDICDGHPSPSNQYHYHRLPMSCIYVDGIQTEQLVGVARDGFPIYGPYQADLGRDATNDDLDFCHGRLVEDRYRYVFLGRGAENYPYVMGCYRAQPVGANNVESCAQCTNGETPCFGVGQICTCLGGPSGGGVDLLSYADTTSHVCREDEASATCRDPHDQTPDDLELEVMKTLR